MDFHSLARRDLQFLCKKNRVPANLTNVAMAKSLEALETVEGIGEIQEALGFQSPKIKSPKLPLAGRRTSSRGATHGDEPKIQEQQPSPLPQSHGVAVKTMEVTEMSSKEEEIQETLGYQSLKVISPELPLTGRKTSVRRAAIGEEPKIQQQKPSPLHRSRRAAAKDLEVTEMASKEEEVEEKDVPKKFPKTPGTRKAVKGVEAKSLRRRAKKNEEVEGHTETPKAVEAKGGKVIGVVTRRSTRLSSRKAMEETATTQSKSRSSSRENAAVKMEALAKEDTVEQEKEEENKDFVEYGDSCAVIVEEHGKKDQEAKSHSFSIDGENSKDVVQNECEATYGDVPTIQQQQLTPRTQSCRVTTKALEATKIFSKEEEDDKKAPKLLHSRQSTRVSSKKPGEEKIREEGTFKVVALTEEDAEEQENQEERKDLVEKSNLRVSSPVVEDEEKDHKLENHAYSSFNEMENRESIVPLVEEVEDNDQEVEIHDFSSSTQGKGANIEVENGNSIIVLVEGDKMKDRKVESQEYSSIEVENEDSFVALIEKNDQEVKINGFSSSTQREDSNIEVENGYSIVVLVQGDETKDQKVEIYDFSSIEVENDHSTVALVEEVEKNDQEGKIHGFSFSSQKEDSNIEVQNDNSTIVEGDEINNQKVEILCFFSSVETGNSKVEVDEAFESTEESGHQPQENEHVKESGDQSPYYEVEVSGDSLPENEHVEYCGDQSSENDFLEDSSNQVSEFAEVSGDLLPTNEAVEDSGDHSSSKIKLAIPAVLDSMLCSEMRPLLHEEAIVCRQGSGGIEEEEGKLSLLLTEMTLKEADESGDALLEPVLAQDISFVHNNSPAAMAIRQDADHIATADIVIPEDDCSSPDLSLAMVSLNKLPCESETMSLIEPSIVQTQSSEEVAMAVTEIAEEQEIAAMSLIEPSIVQTQSSEEVAMAVTEIAEEKEETKTKALEEEEGKLSLLFTEMTIKETEECSDALLEPVVAQDASFISKILPAGMVIRQDDHVATSHMVIPQDDCSSPNLSPAMVSLNKLPCESETIVQTQSSEEVMAATEIAEKKEETKTTDENLELLSLTKLRAMYKQMLNGTKNEQERKKSIIEQEDVDYSSCIKHDENCKQKLNDDMIKLERKSPLIKQEDLECLSRRSKLDSNCKQKLNDDKIKSERKRTPLKNLNYSTF